ncbi:MAG: MFS transporter, partial [Nannocystaceae bacterium]
AFFGPDTGSQRRALLIGLQLVCTCFAGWLALTPATSEHLTTLTWIWVLLNLAASLQDVTTDGVALDLLEPGERGAGNTWMQTGLRIGQLGLGGLLLATLTVSQGLETATKVWVAILGLCVLGPALLPTARLVASARQPRAPLREVLQRFKFGPMLGAAVLALLAMVASAVTSAVAPTFLFQELGLTFADYTRTLLPLMLVFTLVAAPVSTRLISRAGAHYAYALSTLALGAVWIAFGLAEPWWSARATLLLLVSVEAMATVLCFSA